MINEAGVMSDSQIILLRGVATNIGGDVNNDGTGTKTRLAPKVDLESDSAHVGS